MGATQMLKSITTTLLIASVMLLSSCTESDLTGCPLKSESCRKAATCEKAQICTSTGGPAVNKSEFGATKDGIKVDKYTLTNGKGASAEIITYGGIMTALNVPDRDGNFDDVLLGFDSVAGYEANSPYFGAIIGRYGNRIAKGKFTLDGKEYTLAVNDGENSLHGGIKGFDKVVWSAVPSACNREASLTLAYISKDGEEGYPGTLKVIVKYSLTVDNELVMEYEATTDKPTVLNLTNHNYYNLAGQGNGDVLSHELMVDAFGITPVDEGLIPTGEILKVYGPFDFSSPKAIGKDINSDDQQMIYGGGYDHNFVLNKHNKKMTLAATVFEPTTGRFMEVWTEEPGLQFYSGNFLDGSFAGKEGKVYKKRYAFCLETQHFPDSPNKPQFPSTVLRPGEVYKTKTVYKFSAK
jgi:aldose 1-epimerase